jgi:hypothetical protein
MAHILHCDGCNAQDGSIDGNKCSTVHGEDSGAPVATNQTPPRIKVWKNVNVYGKEYDLCNHCVGKINAVLRISSDTPLDGPLALGRLPLTHDCRDDCTF